MQLNELLPEPTPQNKLLFDWLSNNPRRWRGKQILNRKTGQVYTIREVMPSGKVALERKWILFNSDVDTVRQDFERAGP